MTDNCHQPGLLPFAQAKQQMLAAISSISATQTVAIEHARQGILSADVLSTVQVPPHDNSAMDGYALHLHDDKQRLEYRLVGSAFAGEPFAGTLQQGEAIRIMTGGVIPQGANSVVMQEQTTVNNNIVQLSQHPKLGSNIRLAGEDINIDNVIVHKHAQLRPVDIGLLASIGVAKVSVFRPLKVAVFSTGDELTLPGNALKPGHIYESNRFLLIAHLQQLGYEVLDLGIIADEPALITQTFQYAAANADAIVSSGGVSVGEADYTKQVLDELGDIAFWKIAMKPGKPFAFGYIGQTAFFGLPGNPVSTAITFEQLVKPALAKLAGQAVQSPEVFYAITTQPIKKRPGRLDFQRAYASVNQNGDWQVQPFSHQGSGVLSSVAQANCLIVLDAPSGSVEAGQRVSVQWLQH